jgi:hypothetical protein
MQIARMMGTSTASALEAVYADEERKQKQARQSDPLSRQQDSVSISPEALQAYQMMRLNLQEKPDYHGMKQEDKELLGDFSGEAPTAEGASGSGERSDISKLESRLKELQAKLAQVQSSGMPEESKGAMTASIIAEINAVMQEINAKKAKAA